MTDFIKRADLCKVEIDKYRPFEGHMLQQVKSFYRVSTTWSSNALEGNTLTESETKVLLEGGITVGGKTLRETLEASEVKIRNLCSWMDAERGKMHLNMKQKKISFEC